MIKQKLTVTITKMISVTRITLHSAAMDTYRTNVAESKLSCFSTAVAE